MKFTIGADPEFFVKDKDEKLKSIIGLLHGGSKHNPVSIDDMGEFKMLEDNVAAEYNIPPTSDKQRFIQHIQYPQQAIQNIIKDKNLTISTKASASFPEEELKHEMAWVFGCEPDYNAWTKETNEKPECPDKNFRSCGGHIHVGYDWKGDMADILRKVKNMDAWLGLWSVITDPDQERKKLYGKAGAFRPKDYGFEYRVLSNFWIFNPDLIAEVYERTSKAMEETRDFVEKEENKIIKIINEGKTRDAKRFARNYGLLL